MSDISSKDARKADRTAHQAEEDLVRAKDWAEGSSNRAKQESRAMVRAAKRRHSKARRREAKSSLRDF